MYKFAVCYYSGVPRYSITSWLNVSEDVETSRQDVNKIKEKIENRMITCASIDLCNNEASYSLH